MNEVPKRYIPEKNETISASKINSNSIIFEYKNSNKLGSKSNIKEVILIQDDLPSLMEKKKKKTNYGFESTFLSDEKINLSNKKATFFFKINEAPFFYKT